MPRKPRSVHVLCESAEGYRWLKRTVRSTWATEQPDGSFLVTDERRWSEALQAAGGREVQ